MLNLSKQSKATESNESNDLLIEIGTEELPAKGLEALSLAFSEKIATALQKAELSYTKLQTFVTPRRLSVLIDNVACFQADRLNIKRGPAKNQAFDQDGKPTEVLLKFAKACQTDPEKLTLQETTKGAWIVFEQKEPGKSAEVLIPEILQEVFNTLTLQNRMRWDELEESFLRPVHWILLLLGKKSLQATYFGIPSGNKTSGHRFLHPQPITLQKPSEYETKLQEAYVIADFQKRKTSIYEQIQSICAQHQFKPILEETLLNEITGLVEWPVVLLGNFSKDFLALPREVLITSLQNHQKCFAVQDSQGNLLPKFFIVSNLKSLDPHCVIHGNENVITARLADAVFYYHKDQQISLNQRAERLSNVIFQQGLGSVLDKCHRIKILAARLAHPIGASVKDTERAAFLCKADLLTDLVGEFPELQGVMGKYYAKHDKESQAVAFAIEQHYQPRFAQDTLPETKEGISIALADRMDSLLGLFTLGKKPSGDKDPFALRRQALAVLRIMIEKELDLNLTEFLIESINTYRLKSELATQLNKLDLRELLNFFVERLRTFATERNIPVRVFDAVLERTRLLQSGSESEFFNPYDFYRRLLAVHAFQNLPEAESLALSNKRVKNILSKTDDISGNIENHLLQEPAERNLLQAIEQKQQEILPLMQDKQYEEALSKLASLKETLDTFFDQVMVMVEDPHLRNNRLKLLKKLRHLFLEIADISAL